MQIWRSKGGGRWFHAYWLLTKHICISNVLYADAAVLNCLGNNEDLCN